jgi:acylphosphatase
MAGFEQQQRREVRYHGHVQGVGFRFTARRIASTHDVTGFVRNLPDGSVQVVVEGVRDEVDRCLGAIALSMEEHIDRADMTEAMATGEFTVFDVRF